MRKLAFLFMGLGVAMSCSLESDSSRSSSEDDTNAGTLAVNPLSESYPEGLSVSVFATEVSDAVSAGTLAIEDTALLLDSTSGYSSDSFSLASFSADQASCYNTHQEQIQSQPLADFQGSRPEFKHKSGGKRLQESRKRLRGEEDNCASEELFNALKLMEYTTTNGKADQIYCYEFDWGLEHGYQVDKNGAKLPNAEPCLVAFTRSEVTSGQSYIEFATQLSQTLLCQAKKDGSTGELNAGEAFKFTDNLTRALTGRNSGMTISKAQIARLTDQDSKKVFRTDIEFVRSNGTDSVNYELHIVHSPQDDTNTAYKGNIWVKHDLPGQSSTDAKVKAMSLSYLTKNESGKPLRLKFEQRMGEVLSTTSGIFDANGLLDLNAGASSDGSFPSDSNNKYLSNMKLIAFDGFPTEGVMNFSYWRNPGENYNENARGFVFNVTRDTDDTLKGCGIAGASANGDVNQGVSIRQALKTGATLAPKGFLRPFSCGERTGSRVWRQCFRQGKDGQYTIDGQQVEFLDVTDPKIEAVRPPNHGEVNTAGHVDPGAAPPEAHAPPPNFGQKP